MKQYIISGSIYTAHTWDDVRATGGDSLADDTLTTTDFDTEDEAQAAFNTIKNKFDTSKFEKNDVYAIFWLYDVRDDFFINELRIDKEEE